MSSLSTLDVQSIVNELIEYMKQQGRNVSNIESSSFRNDKVWYIQNDINKGRIETKDELISQLKEAFNRAGTPLYSRGEEDVLTHALKYIH